MLFKAYVGEYARALTGQRSLRPAVLVNACGRRDQAKEACFFYLLATDRLPQALEIAATGPLGVEWAELYGRVRHCKTFDDLWEVAPALPERYGKVLMAYHEHEHRRERNRRIKQSVREDFAKWSDELGLSDRSVALRAGVDPSNLSAFSRRGELGRLSMDAVRRVRDVYVQALRREASG